MKVTLNQVQAAGLQALAQRTAGWEQVKEATFLILAAKGLVEPVERNPLTAPNGKDHTWQLTPLGKTVATAIGRPKVPSQRQPS